MSWITAVGCWLPVGLNVYCGPASKSRSTEPKKQRKHHYAFDVDDNGLDINGFILHTDKHEGKRHKFRVYLDSNENGRFDKNDPLIGRTVHTVHTVSALLTTAEASKLIMAEPWQHQL